MFLTFSFFGHWYCTWEEIPRTYYNENQFNMSEFQKYSYFAIKISSSYHPGLQISYDNYTLKYLFKSSKTTGCVNNSAKGQVLYSKTK